MRLAILLFFNFICGACSQVLFNHFNEMRYVCGDGYQEGRDYISISDPSNPTNFQFTALSKEMTGITKNGCIERPSDESIFVVNGSKTAGILVENSSNKFLHLEPLFNSSIPATCSANLHKDGGGFTLKFNLEETSSSLRMQKYTLAIKDISGITLSNWPSRKLDTESSVFRFDPIRFIVSGNYILEAVISDEIRKVSVVSHCSLRVDRSEFQVFPSEKIERKIDFNGAELNIVNPGYSLNFYVEDGIRDVSIEFCFSKIKPSDIQLKVGSEFLKCNKPELFQTAEIKPLDEGFWILVYRSKRGSVQTDWKQDYFSVTKECEGKFIELSALSGMNCTVINGDLEVSKINDEERYISESIFEIKGNLTINSFENDSFDSFNHLHFVHGSISIEDSNRLKYLSGFKSLVQIDRDLIIGSLSSLMVVDSFKNLAIVLGDLYMFDIESPSINCLGSINTIGGTLRLEGLSITSLSFLNKLSSLRFFELMGPVRNRGVGQRKLIDSLSGLQSLRFIEKMIIHRGYSMANISGVKLEKIGEIQLDKLPNLTMIKVDNDLIIDSIKINECPFFEGFIGDSIVSIERSIDFSGENFSKIFGLKFSKKLSDVFLQTPSFDFSFLMKIDDVSESFIVNSSECLPKNVLAKIASFSASNKKINSSSGSCDL